MDKLIQPEDAKFYVHKPDSSFSPERNKAIINETIKETEAYFRGIGKAITDNLGTRIEIMTAFGDYKLNRSGEKNIKEYLGKELYGKIVGERILEKIRVAQSVERLTGRKERFIQL